MKRGLADASRRALERAEAAEAASEAKGHFLAHISHELRTPLTTILGYSEMLQEDAEAAGLRAYSVDLQKIRSAGLHLLDLVNQMLDVSRIEAGKVDVCRDEFDLCDLLREAIDALQPLASKNGDVLTFDSHVGSMLVVTDRTKVRQVVLNLLSNAVKFTKDGAVRLRLSEGELAGAPAAKISVEDEGIGMSEPELARLFRPYAQATPLIVRKYGGTGLGLVLVRKYVQLLGGALEVESAPGAGSTFTVRLPVSIL